MLGDVAVTARSSGMTAEIWDIGGRVDPGDDPKRLLQPEKEHRLMAFLRTLPSHVGVYCESDHVGVIVCRVAGLLGLRIPEDLAVMGFGDNLVSRFSDPPLTSVVTPGRAIGRLAAMTLSRWMKHEDAPPVEQLVGGIELTPRESTLGSSGSPELARVRRRIATHGARGLTLSDLVGISGFSVKTLIRRYKEAFGTDPSEDIRKARIAEATRLLRDTKLSVAEIAEECGFSSQAGLYNYLKRHAGWGPSDFRKSSD
jgi:LacI family transcriptional regulator